MDSDEPNVRRRGRRRVRRGGLGGSPGVGVSTEARSLRYSDDGEMDTVDTAIDPEHVHDHVTRSQGQGQSLVPDSPGNRLREVERSGSAAYSREYRLSLLHRFLIRKVPLDQIARQLGVSISTLEKDRVALKEQLRARARDLDIDEMIGRQSSVYEEVEGMAMQIASRASGDNAVPVPMQLAALRTVLAANADKSRFYHTAGVFDAMRFRAPDGSGGQTDIQRLMQQTASMLRELRSDGAGMSGFDDINEEEPEGVDL